MNLGIYSRKLKRTKSLAQFVPEYSLVSSYIADAYTGWGYKRWAKKPRRLAKKYNKPYIALEDGFLRSYGLGVHGDYPLSIVVDKTGIYYDATKPSDIENLIKNSQLNESQIARAKSAITKIHEYKLTKYNHNIHEWMKPSNKPCVLVIDQCAGDASIEYGMANADSFKKMLAAARAENPNHHLIIKVHPDVIAGKRKGYIELDEVKDATILTENINPHILFQNIEKVYVVTSLLGFEALLCGLPVRCFGMPFYAGWGITQDETKCARRDVGRSIEEIFYAAYIEYARYINPYTGRRCELEEVIGVLAFLKKYYARHSTSYHCWGFSKWKRYFIKPYLKIPSNFVKFHKFSYFAIRAAKRDNTPILIWAAKETPEFLQKAESLKIYRMEDGFIRSVGLGSDFIAANSLILDKAGIHFNYDIPSELENMLNSRDFDKAILNRAKDLREFITSNSLTKYNTEAKKADLDLPQGKKIILAVGQVEGDASIRFGSPEIKTNQHLINEIRRNNHDAYIVYKPHPDVVSGNREGDWKAENTDKIVTDIGIHALIKKVDEVHTITSLVGFESLLQGKKVVVYGLPFYAGWGLTEDKIKHPRRIRQRNIDELVAAALIEYPLYFDFESGIPCPPEVITSKLAKKAYVKPKSHIVMRALNGIISVFKR